MNDLAQAPANTPKKPTPQWLKVAYIVGSVCVLAIAFIVFKTFNKPASQQLAFSIPPYPGAQQWRVDHFSGFPETQPHSAVYFDTNDDIDSIIQYYTQQPGWSVGEVQRNARGYSNTESAKFSINGKEVQLFFNDVSFLGKSYYKGKALPAHIHSFLIWDKPQPTVNR